MSNDLEVRSMFFGMRSALEDIARTNDCDYIFEAEKDRPKPCTCPKHMALAALDRLDNWRYQGARSERLETSPRERKIIAAWRSQVDDQRLRQILSNETVEITSRDWFVATSVVQWLATNVGMEVLRRAGWEYKQWDEDRAELDARMKKQQEK